MRKLEGYELSGAMHYCGVAAKLAAHSGCRKSQHGAVIVLDDKIIGEGFNTPVPGNRPCEPCLREDIHDNSRVELCNAIHAEQNASDYALEAFGELAGARLYHARLKDGKLARKNTPSCTLCSRLLLHKKMEGIVLIQGDDYVMFGAEEFNRLSFDYFLKPRQ